MPSRKRARLSSSQAKPTLGLDAALDTRTAEELELEAELFPGQAGPSRHANALVADEEEFTGFADEQLFFVDTTNAQRPDEAEDKPADVRKPRKGKAPALWVDPADEHLSVSLQDVPRRRKLRKKAEEDVVDGEEYAARLRQQFEKTNPAPAWASVARKEAQRKKERVAEDEDDVTNLLRAAGAGTRSSKSRALKQGELNLTRLKDANVESNSKSDITALGFHPEVQVLFTTSRDRRMKLYTIDGSNNPLLQTVHLPEMPIELAAFHPSGDNIFLAGPKPHFFTYDLQSGRMLRSPRGLWNTGLGGQDTENQPGGITHFRHSPDGKILACSGRRGYIHLLDVRAAGSGMVVGQFRHSSSGIAGLSWSPDSTTLTSIGKDAEAYVWDVRAQSCTGRWRDEGGFGTVALEGDRSGSYLAVGSSTGVVNVYDQSAHTISPAQHGIAAERKPLRAVQNLTTEVSTMRFNHDSQLLALGSDKKKDQFKLVHLPSLTVFQNWPTQSTPLGRVTAVDFSRQSEYIAVGSAQGKVLLYSLGHYSSRR